MVFCTIVWHELTIQAVDFCSELLAAIKVIQDEIPAAHCSDRRDLVGGEKSFPTPCPALLRKAACSGNDGDMRALWGAYTAE